MAKDSSKTNLYVAIGCVVAIVLIVFLVAISFSNQEASTDTTGQVYQASVVQNKAVVTSHPLSDPIAPAYLRND